MLKYRDLRPHKAVWYGFYFPEMIIKRSWQTLKSVILVHLAHFDLLLQSVRMRKERTWLTNLKANDVQVRSCITLLFSFTFSYASLNVFQVNVEFTRITTKPLVSTFMSLLDLYTDPLLKAFRKKGGTPGQKIKGIMAAMDKVDSTMKSLKWWNQYKRLLNPNLVFWKTCQRSLKIFFLFISNIWNDKGAIPGLKGQITYAVPGLNGLNGVFWALYPVPQAFTFSLIKLITIP